MPLGYVAIDQTTLHGNEVVVIKSGTPSSAPLNHRAAVVAADVCAVPGAVTCTKLTGVGALTAGVYYVKVVAGNTYGRTTATNGNATVTTETTNLGVRAAFAQVAGATFYDIYCSTAADPLWVGRITEVQRASGIILTAVNTTGAGGTAGAVNIYPIGTGLAAGVTAVVNTAYIPPAGIDCTGHQYIDFDLSMTRSGDAVAPALVVVPYFYNSRLSSSFAGTPVTVSFGGTTGQYGAMQQRLRVECRGNDAMALAVQQIAGTGASLNVDYTLN